MSLEQCIGLGLAIIIMVIGLVGNVIPGLPGTPLILAAALVHRLYFGSAGPSNTVLLVLTALTLLAMGLDFLASLVGAKKLGATWRGIFGAMTGAIVGLWFGPLGLILGPFLGALICEWMGGQEFNRAARAGVGALLGLLLSAVAKTSCGLLMILIFAINVLHRSQLGPEAVLASAFNSHLFV